MRNTHRNLLVAAGAAAAGLMLLAFWLSGASASGDLVHAALPASIQNRGQMGAPGKAQLTTSAGIQAARLVPVKDPGVAPDTAPSAAPTGRITGRVTSDDPTLDFTKVKVAATPAGTYFSLNFTSADRLARPGDYAWAIGTCDANGEFVLEEGIEPRAPYHLTAAGDGSVSPTHWKRTYGAGDDATLPLAPLYGLEVLFVDELQRTWEWPDHYSPPCNLAPSDRSVDASNVSHIALALHGLPVWLEGRSSGLIRSYAVDRPDLEVTVSAFPGWDHPRQQFTEQLHPVRRGLRRVTKVVPGAGESHPPVTVVFPDGLLELMLGDEDKLSIHWMLGFCRKGKFGQYEFRPRFGRGKNTWTTTDIPPGTYTAQFRVTMNDRLGLSPDPEATGFQFNEDLELGPDGTTLYVPSVSYATVELTGIKERLGKHTETVVSSFDDPTGGPTGGFARFDGPPYRIPILWDPEVHAKRPWTFKASTPKGKVEFVGEDGEAPVRLRHGENVRVSLPPAEWAPGPGAIAR